MNFYDNFIGFEFNIQIQLSVFPISAEHDIFDLSHQDYGHLSPW